MTKTTYRIKNWKQYNQALIQRGSLTLWVSQEVIDGWKYDGENQHGGQFTYSDLAIETCLKLRLVYHLGLRQTQGFVASLFGLLDLDETPVPNYSTLSRRHDGLPVVLCDNTADKPEARHIVIDSTGLKLYGEGEWKMRQHGKSKRRTWRKLHLALDVDTGEITATVLTDNSIDDASQAEALLDQTLESTASISHVGGDGGYDKWKCYAALDAIGAEPVIPPQVNAKIKQHGNCAAAPLPRDEAIRYIRRHGRKKWKRDHGYHRRSLAETAMFRYKRIIGPDLRARELARQQTEARLGSKVLNQMAAIGMPDSYAVCIA